MDREQPDGAPEGLSTGPNMRAMNVWNSVIDDMEATAADLEDAGWTTQELHPGDVIVATNIEEPGIDTVLPNAEFQALADLVEDGVSFEEYDVFRAGGEGIEYALVVAKDTKNSVAVLIPLYYEVADLAEVARGKAEIPIYLRQLDEEMVILQLTEPDLLLPDPEDATE